MKVRVSSMVIQTNKLSLSLHQADMLKNIGVSVPSAMDGSTSRVDTGMTMEGPVQKKAGSETSVYTEAEALQQDINIEDGVLSDDSQMSPADFISQCTTGEDAKAVSDEQTPLEDYTSSQLERTISRIKEERRDRAEGVEDQVEKESEEAQALEEAAQTALAEQQISSQIVQQMQNSGLPVTPENVMRLSHAIDMAAQIASFSEASMKFFIAQNLTLTPENICGSVYSVQGMGEENPLPQMQSDFSEVQEQVHDLLAKDGIEADEQSMAVAKWLYENDLPVNAKTITACESVDEFKELPEEIRMARVADNMADGVSPEKADLNKISVTEAITAKRRLAEIRLTMSIEAVRNLSAKGIRLDVSNMEKIVEQLRIEERQAKESLLEETGLPASEQNIQTMGDTLKAARQVLAAPVPFLGKAVETQKTDTLRDLAQNAVRFTEEFGKLEKNYESVGTEVRRDLGDSMQKAFQNVDDILDDLAYEHTEQNQRAVRSLAYNQIPLTEENIDRVKEYDIRITSLLKEMKPPVVAELIRRDINPLEISLDELNRYVSDIQNDLGTEDITFSRYLWKLDHQNEVTPEERETMIGVYRLLDKIEKSDGALAGQLMKEDRELSLQSLLSALRTRRDAGMDIQIDDSFGELEQLTVQSTSISGQIQTAYQKNIAKQLQKSLSPSVLREHLEDDTGLESLLDLCRSSQEEETQYYEQMIKEWQETLSAGSERLQKFLNEIELPDTLTNLQEAQSFLKQGRKDISAYWEPEDSEAVLDAMEQPEELDKIYDDLDKKHKQTVEKTKEKDDITYDDMRNAARMNGHIAFCGKLRSYQMYEVPVFTEQGITNCRVTIQNGTEDRKGLLEISMESEELGRLQASIKLNDKHVKGFVTVEDKEQIALCQRRMHEFEKDLEENGYTMDSGSLLEGSRDSLHVGNKEEGTKNADLYRIAKIFIIKMSRKDDGE